VNAKAGNYLNIPSGLKIQEQLKPGKALAALDGKESSSANKF
jgi:hypothetical protein